MRIGQNVDSVDELVLGEENARVLTNNSSHSRNRNSQNVTEKSQAYDKSTRQDIVAADLRFYLPTLSSWICYVDFRLVATFATNSQQIKVSGVCAGKSRVTSTSLIGLPRSARRRLKPRFHPTQRTQVSTQRST